MSDLLLLIVIGSSKKPIWMFQTTEHYFSICGCYVSAKTKTWVLTASCPSIKEYCNSQNSFNFQSRMCTMRRSTITASLWCNLNRFFFSFSKIERKREFFELWFYATDCKRKWVRQFLHNCNQKAYFSSMKERKCLMESSFGGNFSNLHCRKVPFYPTSFHNHNKSESKFLATLHCRHSRMAVVVHKVEN